MPMQETITSHPVVCFGETLWDILPHAKLPGGAPANVAYHLNKLGKHPAIISRIGIDDLGKELIRVFESGRLATEYFQVDYENTTGKVYAELKEHNEVHYDIVKPVAWDFIEWEDDFIPLLEDAEYFVFGSLATRSKTSRNTLYECLERSRTKVLDINMRPPHYNKKIIEELLRRADILKLNLAELHLVTGWFSNYNSDEDRIKLLKDRFRLNHIIVTKGGDGAIVNEGDQFYHHDGYSVKVADTVGSGDAFLAGFIASLLEQKTPDEALDFASRMGAFVASRKGGCPEYTPAMIHELFPVYQIKTVND